MAAYLVTHSLLSSWLHLIRENPYEDLTTEGDPLAEFMLVLRREPTPRTEAMQNGIDFENLVTSIVNGHDTRSTSRSTSTLLRTSRGSDTSACKTVGHRTSIFKNNETARIGGCRPCACKIRLLTDFFRSLQEIKKKSTILQTKYSAFLVENTGIEPVTSCMPCKRSPS